MDSPSEIGRRPSPRFRRPDPDGARKESPIAIGIASEMDPSTTYFRGRVSRLVSDRHLRKGPSFPKPADLTIHFATSKVTWRQVNHGREEVRTEHVDLPDDLANGMIPLVVENISPGMEPIKISYLVVDPKPRVVKLVISPSSVDMFIPAGAIRNAKKYRIHIELGGIAGAVAPILGMQPPDVFMWVSDGEVSTVIKTQGAFYEGGPIWTIEQAAPRWQSIVRESSCNHHLNESISDNAVGIIDIVKSICSV